MAAHEEIEPFFLGFVEGVLLQFAGDERVDSGGAEVRNGALAAAGEDRDAVGIRAAELNGVEGVGKFFAQPGGEGFAVERAGGDDADIVAFVREKSAGRFEAEAAGEEDVVADFRVEIEREMRAVNGAISADEGFDFLERRAGDRRNRVPEHSVVDDEEIDVALHRFAKRFEARVDRRADPADFAVVFELESVAGSGEIADLVNVGALIAKSDDLGKSGHAFQQSSEGGGCKGGGLREAGVSERLEDDDLDDRTFDAEFRGVFAGASVGADRDAGGCSRNAGFAAVSTLRSGIFGGGASGEWDRLPAFSGIGRKAESGSGIAERRVAASGFSRLRGSYGDGGIREQRGDVDAVGGAAAGGDDVCGGGLVAVSPVAGGGFSEGSGVDGVAYFRGKFGEGASVYLGGAIGGRGVELFERGGTGAVAEKRVRLAARFRRGGFGFFWSCVEFRWK